MFMFYIEVMMSVPTSKYNLEISEEVLEEIPNDKPVVVTLPLDVYNELSESLRNIQNDVVLIKEQAQKLTQQKLAQADSLATPDSYLFDPIRKLMPLRSIKDLIGFEKFLGIKDNTEKFVSYVYLSVFHVRIKNVYFQQKFLASFVLLKKPLKETTMSFIEKVYDLELQQLVNYSGAEGKQALKSLCSTQVLMSKYFSHSM